MLKKELENWDNATDKLAEAFVEKYFEKDLIYDDDYYWIGSQDEDREVLAVADYFFNLDTIISFIRYKYTKKELFDYYDYMLKDDEVLVNIKTWKKTNKTKLC